MMQPLVIVAVLAVVSQSNADAVVEQLRSLPAPLPSPRASRRPVPSEVTRRNLYEQLREMGAASLPALACGLRHPDVALRRNVTLALEALGGTWWDRTKAPLDIAPILPDLVAALDDEDGLVRGWAAQAIAHTGAAGAPAVPALIRLLGRRDDEGSRNSACIGLRGIGPPAKAALPALRTALSDPSRDVRRFAQLAIESIQRP